MDGARFDRVARWWGGRRSRRGVVAAGVAGLAGVVGVRAGAARPYSVPLGGSCFHDRQCIPSTPDDPLSDIVSCRDNGLSWDGSFNCCREYAGRCWDDGDCCGYLTCNAGYCSSRFDYAGPVGQSLLSKPLDSASDKSCVYFVGVAWCCPGEDQHRRTETKRWRS